MFLRENLCHCHHARKKNGGKYPLPIDGMQKVPRGDPAWVTDGVGLSEDLSSIKEKRSGCSVVQ